MASILTLLTAQPTRRLGPGEALVTAGDSGGELYALESGRLVVERDGVQLAVFTEPGALIGEIAVLLGNEHSATVTAETETVVRVIEDGVRFLEQSPLLALHVATEACARLDATSALLVALRRESAGREEEQGLLSRIFSALAAPPEPRLARD